MIDKVDFLFEFLINNRRYNHELQTKSYNNFVTPYNMVEDRIIFILHNIINTQSQPKIGNVSKFNRFIAENRKHLGSFISFLELLNQDKTIFNNYFNCNYKFKLLFDGLKKQDGWGNKTAALFVKTIYHIHNGKYNVPSVWNDVPKIITHEDSFYLPVDSVILHIFDRITAGRKNSFDSINSLLQKRYSPQEMEIWDDLWFWGFITQKTLKGGRRELAWNDDKYWALNETDKSFVVINEIKLKACDFINLLL